MDKQPLSMEKKQLFHLLNDVDISHEAHYNPLAQTYSPRRVVAPATFAVTWPDGTPCSLVEMYLISRFQRGASVREDGGSLRATVAKLSHLIRRCWEIKRYFWELEDEDIYQLVVKLQEEMKPTAPLVRARDNNTVRAIIAAAVEFLLWLQAEMLSGIKLIGVGPEYRILLAERRTLNSRRNRYIIQLMYHRLPPTETKEPKRPISREKRNLLWQAVGQLEKVDLVLPAWAQKGNYSSMLTSYLKARRELLLELLEATGARPGELSRLSASTNEDCYKTGELVLVTLKRRRDIERKIKLQPGVAMRLTVFLKKHRAALLKTIKAAGIEPASKDRVFLGLIGCPISERTMVSEFCRISKAAGLGEYQSCMSMFRHRFITKQVAIHLGIYLNENNKTREMMTDGDYRTILKKVATITGHGSETSLLRYVDLAWEELGMTGHVAKAVALDASIEGATTQVISLIGAIEKGDGRSAGGLLRKAEEVLRQLQQEIQTALKTSTP